MRKAFDANIPKLKPRLRPNGAPSATLPLDPDAAEPAAAEPVEAAAAAPIAAPVTVAPAPEVAAAPAPAVAPTPVPVAAAPAVTVPAAPAPVAVVAAPAPAAPVAAPATATVAAPVPDVDGRRERLAKIKRRVADAARPSPRPEPVPTDPARAAESVLALVRDLEGELSRSREREDALRADLEDARGQAGRAAAEARASVERLQVVEQELEAKRTVLGELLGEMTALEEERDEAVRRAQALSALDEERARLLDDLSRRADEEARLRAEREEEVERLSEELRTGAVEGARLRAALTDLARERDDLSVEVQRTREERDALAAAKRALEQVHAALAQARARLG
jgi:septal ring factor EnvC (AmiA/AmiB activator)